MAKLQTLEELTADVRAFLLANHSFDPTTEDILETPFDTLVKEVARFIMARDTRTDLGGVEDKQPLPYVVLGNASFELRIHPKKERVGSKKWTTKLLRYEALAALAHDALSEVLND